MSEQIKIQDMSANREGWRPTQGEVVEFLHGQHLCVIASLNNEGHPQVATVAFSETDALELIVGTDESSRKAQNMDENPHVAIVVTDPQARYTVQAEGLARKLGKDEFEAYADRHFDKLPASAPFKDIEGQCYYLITPTYLRFSDCNPHPWQLTEFTFNND